MSIVILSLFNCSSKEKNIVENVEKAMDSIPYILDETLLRETYKTFEGYCPSEGYVDTPKLAVQLADIILCSIYGKEEIAEQYPFQVHLDNGVWVIEGYIEEGLMGGSAYIEIDKKTGAVLKLLHTK